MTINEHFQSMTIEKAFDYLKSSADGLSSEEVNNRILLFGKNALEEEKIDKLEIFLRQFKNVFIYVLLIASLVSLALGELGDFVVINIIVFINSIVGFWQEFKSESGIMALKKLTQSKVDVVRDAKIAKINAADLVPGDVVVCYEGTVVPADIRLFESFGVMANEASITGESVPVAKDHSSLVSENALPYDYTNILLMGSFVVRGVCKGLVIKTGKKTYLAEISEKAQEPSPETPLTRALNFFTKRYVLLLILLFFTLGVIGHFQGRSILNLAHILLASLVSAVPEGLPIVVTLVMVIGALALSRNQALIRHLPSVETLGSTTLIASDKTGTITEGKLAVKEVYAKDLEFLKLIAALCNDSHEGSGDPLDVVLSQWVENFLDIKNKCPQKWDYPFDNHFMLMASVNEIKGEQVLCVKGAYESLRERAKDKTGLNEMDAAFDELLGQGLRVLAFAKGEWETNDPCLWRLDIVGLIGFLDPPKAGVKEAVLSAKSAGLQVIMITGDHPLTAKAVAKEVHIWQEGDHILTGKEIEVLEDEQLFASLKTATVLARILPEHKYRVVKVLQSKGEIVAVTGDGINDVPALKAADIGISMGTGTDAAKSVSKMVIVDNNLKVIVSAIKNARIISDNIRKVIYYLLSTTLQEIGFIAFSILTSFPMPLSAAQILWINIVTDGVQDKFFAFAKEEGDVMQRKPIAPDKQFFDYKQIYRIMFFGLSTGLLCFLIYIYIFQSYSFSIVSTIMFTCIASAQWANGIQSQKENEPFFKNFKRSISINPLIFLGAGLGLLLQIVAIYLLSELFHSAPLNAGQWIYPLFVFIFSFGIIEIRKWAEQLKPEARG